MAQTIFALLKLGQGNSKFFLFFMPDEHVPRFLRGTIYNPDHFAFYLELLFPIALGLLFARLHIFDPGQSLREKILHIAEDRRVILLFLAPVVLAAGIYLTGCRSGIAVLVLSVLFFAQMSVYLRVNFSARRHLRLLFILATLLAVFIGVQSTLDKFLTGNYIERSARIDYWSQHLGHGRRFPRVRHRPGHLQIRLFPLRQGDGLGRPRPQRICRNRCPTWGSWLSSFFSPCWPSWPFPCCACGSPRRHPEIKPVVLGVLTALFAAFFHSFFDFSLRIPANAFLFLTLLALGLKLVTHRHEFADENK